MAQLATIQELNKKGDQIFCDPRPTCSYEELVQRSLTQNTYRGFHRIDKQKPGAKEAFQRTLRAQKSNIISNLNSAESEHDIDKLADRLCEILIKNLSNIKQKQLHSYNKLRKPIDIVLEHMVAIGSDFERARKKTIDHLFLPLDSQIFMHDLIFSDQERRGLSIKRSFTFKDIKTRNHYIKIQNFLKTKANRLGLKRRIYFDLLWNDRYKQNGTNLLRTNPR